MFDSAIYKNRRQALRNKVQNGLILILGNNEAPANYPDNTYKFFHVFKERCQQAGFIPNIVFSSPNFATVFALLKQYHNWIGYSFDFYIDQVMDEEIVTLPVEDGGWSWDVYIAYKPIVRSNYVAQFVNDVLHYLGSETAHGG